MSQSPVPFSICSRFSRKRLNATVALLSFLDRYSRFDLASTHAATFITDMAVLLQIYHINDVEEHNVELWRFSCNWQKLQDRCCQGLFIVRLRSFNHPRWPVLAYVHSSSHGLARMIWYCWQPIRTTSQQLCLTSMLRTTYIRASCHSIDIISCEKSLETFYTNSFGWRML